MKRYTVTFLFDPEHEHVWLIEKQKPEWQKGCLNGIGGKIENGETPLECAIRELKEEAGFEVHPDFPIIEMGLMRGTNNDGSSFEVHIFTGTTAQILKSQEGEEIYIYAIGAIKRHFKYIENVPTLIEACLYKLEGHSHFNKIIMEYTS